MYSLSHARSSNSTSLQFINDLKSRGDIGTTPGCPDSELTGGAMVLKNSHFSWSDNLSYRAATCFGVFFATPLSPVASQRNAAAVGETSAFRLDGLAAAGVLQLYPT